MAHVFNKSIFAGVFPDALKCANILPLFKKGVSSELGNYRLISLLPSIRKIFEKAVKNRMMKFLTRTSFFSNVQFGFQSNKSTEDALLQFCSQLFVNLDKKKKNTAALFVDISKAFDMVNHEILIHKLERNRTQRVKFGDITSETKTINLGVPQGSVLGLILFLVYINSLFRLLFNGLLTAFADDVGFTYGTDSFLNLISDS